MNGIKTDRRAFMLKTGPIMAAALVGSAVMGTAVNAAAEEHHHETMAGHGGSDGYVMGTSIQGHCGTCEFWGGPRRVSKDGKTLTITGLGWCNNPKCSGYQGMSSPDHQCGGTWRKWSILG